MGTVGSKGQDLLWDASRNSVIKQENLGNVQTHHGMLWRLPQEEEGGVEWVRVDGGGSKVPAVPCLPLAEPKSQLAPKLSCLLIKPCSQVFGGSLLSVPWDLRGPPAIVEPEQLRS